MPWLRHPVIESHDGSIFPQVRNPPPSPVPSAPRMFMGMQSKYPLLPMHTRSLAIHARDMCHVTDREGMETIHTNTPPTWMLFNAARDASDVVSSRSKILFRRYSDRAMLFSKTAVAHLATPTQVSASPPHEC